MNIRLSHLSLLLTLIFSQPGFAESVLFNQQELNLGPHLSAIEDQHSSLNASSVLAKKTFIPLTEQQPSFGYSASSFWLRGEFNTNISQQAFLEIANPRLDEVDFYLYRDGQLIYQFDTGDQKPFSVRAFNHHNFIFPLALQAKKQYLLLLRVKSTDNLFLPLTLWTETAFHNEQSISTVTFGFFYGTLAIMVIINLLIFITIKDRNYLIFSLFLLFTGLTFFALNGLANRFFWGEWVWWGKQSLTFLEGFAAVFGLLFSRSFLNTVHYAPRFDRFLALLIPVAGFASLLAILVDYTWSVLIMSVVTIVAPIVTLISAYICWKHQYRPARYFLIAWSLFLIGAIIYGLMLHQLLPSNLVTQYGMHAGLMWLAVLLSLALTDRVNHLKQQKEQAQFETIQQQEITLNYQKRMMASISRFVPTQFLSLLEKVDITDVKYGDATLKNMFIMFTDIRGFTSLSETMTPEENLKFLNSYMTFMEPVVEKNHGFIDKFIGDAIMALFPDRADNALQAAIEMQLQLHVFNTQCPQYNGIKIGIGLHGGDVMLGTVGSDTRLETTVIGDAVNLTSRLESLTKEKRVPIIISEQLFLALRRPESFNIHPLDDVSIRGKSQLVKVYQVQVS